MNAAKNCNAGCTGIDWAKAGICIKLRKIRNYEDPVAVIGFDVVLGNLHAHMIFLATLLLKSSSAFARYTELVDVWAFGVLMYLLMYGPHPSNVKPGASCCAKRCNTSIPQGEYPYDAKEPKEIMIKAALRAQAVQTQTSPTTSTAR